MNKKLLFISAFDPFNINSGGSLRSNKILSRLSNKFDTRVLYFGENSSKINSDLVSVKKFALQKNSGLNSWKNLIPYWFTPWFNKKFISELKIILQENSFDAILIEGTQLFYINKYLPKNRLVFFSAYDIQTISFFRRLSACNVKNILVHIFRFIEVFLYELIWLKKVKSLICVSKNDQEIFQKYFKVKNTYVLPNGLDLKNKLREKNKSNTLRLGFIGSINHPPNKQAISTLLYKIAPKLDGVMNFTLTVVSKDINKFVNPNSLSRNIKFYDEINDLSLFFNNIDLLVTPIYSGSGSRIKILDAISHQVPIISTKMGIEGILEELLGCVSIANTTGEFVNEIKKCSQKNISCEIDKEIIHKYSWNKLIDSFYEHIINLLEK